MAELTLESVRTVVTAVVEEKIAPIRKLAESTDRAIRGENGHPGMVTKLETTKKDVEKNTKDINNIKNEQDKRKYHFRSMWAGVGIALIGVAGKYIFK